MEIQDHIDFLHGLEDWIVQLIGLDPTFRVGCYSTRIGFHAYNACLLGGPYLLGREFGGEVEGHEIVDGRVDGFEFLFVSQSLGRCGDWGLEIGLLRR